MNRIATGTFVVFDGGEGAGKSTQIQRLQQYYGDRCVTTREPGGSVLAEKIREIILSDIAKDAGADTMFALFWAARAAHLQEFVIPALREGKLVLCDRFDSSTYAYQIYGYREEKLLDLFWAMRHHYLRMCIPDLYVIFEIDPEVGLRRANQRSGEITHFDRRDLQFHERVRQGMRAFVDNKPHIFIDAAKSQEEVAKSIIEALAFVL